MNDVEDYFNAGTIHRALAEINKNSASQSQNAQDKLNQLKGVQPMLNPTAPPGNLGGTPPPPPPPPGAKP